MKRLAVVTAMTPMTLTTLSTLTSLTTDKTSNMGFVTESATDQVGPSKYTTRTFHLLDQFPSAGYRMHSFEFTSPS